MLFPPEVLDACCLAATRAVCEAQFWYRRASIHKGLNYRILEKIEREMAIGFEGEALGLAKLLKRG